MEYLEQIINQVINLADIAFAITLVGQDDEGDGDQPDPPKGGNRSEQTSSLKQIEFVYPIALPVPIWYNP